VRLTLAMVLRPLFLSLFFWLYCGINSGTHASRQPPFEPYSSPFASVNFGIVSCVFARSWPGLRSSYLQPPALLESQVHTTTLCLQSEMRSH
jgi:hypothetical protein